MKYGSGYSLDEPAKARLVIANGRAGLDISRRPFPG